MRISRDYPVQTQLAKRTIGDFSGFEIIPFHPLKYTISKHALIAIQYKQMHVHAKTTDGTGQHLTQTLDQQHSDVLTLGVQCRDHALTTGGQDSFPEIG